MSKDKKRSPMQDLATAYHEAGHAVASLALGIRVRSASIVPNRESAIDGYVRSQKIGRNTARNIEWADRFTRSRLQAEKRVMVWMAGELAQRRFNPRSVRSYHASMDREEIVDMLMRYARPRLSEAIDVTSHYKLLKEWTAELLDENWILVEAVANALVKRRTLSGSEMRNIVFVASGQNYPQIRL
jgi:ATP-dependent Zn protease